MLLEGSVCLIRVTRAGFTVLYVPNVYTWDWFKKGTFTLSYGKKRVLEAEVNPSEYYSISKSGVEYLIDSDHAFITIVNALSDTTVIFGDRLCDSPLFSTSECHSEEDRLHKVKTVVGVFPPQYLTVITTFFYTSQVSNGYFTTIKKDIDTTNNVGTSTPPSSKWLACGCSVDGSSITVSEECRYYHTYLNDNTWKVGMHQTPLVSIEWEDTPKFMKVNSEHLKAFVSKQESRGQSSYNLLIQNVKYVSPLAGRISF